MKLNKPKLLLVLLVSTLLIGTSQAITEVEKESLFTTLTADNQEAFNNATTDVEEAESMVLIAEETTSALISTYADSVTDADIKQSELNSAAENLSSSQDTLESTHADFNTAQEQLATAISDEDIATATTTLNTAQISLSQSETALESMQTIADRAKTEYDYAVILLNENEIDMLASQEVLSLAESVLNEANEALSLILAELAATQDLLGQLSDDQIETLFKSLKNAADEKLIVNIDSSDLQTIIDNGYSENEIKSFTQAFEKEAKMLAIAAQLSANGQEDQAEAMEIKAEREKQKFLTKAANKAEKRTETQEKKAAVTQEKKAAVTQEKKTKAAALKKSAKTVSSSSYSGN